MARYATGGKVIDTEKASAFWHEDTWFDGHNEISRATGLQWTHEKLYKSSKGNYYLECWSDWQGVQATAHFITEDEAAEWLITNNHAVPAELSQNADRVAE